MCTVGRSLEERAEQPMGCEMMSKPTKYQEVQRGSGGCLQLVRDSRPPVVRRRHCMTTLCL